jgi:hypothetical protein
VPSSLQITAAVRAWFADAFLRQNNDSEVVSWRRNVRNWRRYNWKVTLGPVDNRGCRRVTVEWDEDYEYEVVIVIRRKPSLGLGYGQSFDLGGTREYRIGWFEVTGEHHRESGIECPGDLGYASVAPRRSTVAVDGAVIWKGSDAPQVTVTTGGITAPILTGNDGHLAAFAEWLRAKTATARARRKLTSRRARRKKPLRRG